MALHKPQVKVCGLTRVDEATRCAALGADAIGLVFYAKSPRNVTLEQAGAICKALPPEICKVGVFVDATLEFIMERVETCGLQIAQLHGNESPALATRLMEKKVKVLKALFMSREPGLGVAATFSATAFLLECGIGKLPGGNAKAWDWGAAKAFGGQYPLVLAGGLTPDNVQTAVSAAMPDAVDVSSGVESSPGRKDLDKVKALIQSLAVTSVPRSLRPVFSGAPAIQI